MISPGTPTTETLQKLQAAVQNVPNSQPQPAASAEPTRPQPVQEKPRFGFNRLIDRMTGHATDTPSQPVRQQPPLRQHDATAPAHDDGDPEQDRIEIPAFLRRQAN